MNAKKFKLELQKGIQLKIIDEFFIRKLFQNEKVSFLNNISIEELLEENYEVILDNCSIGCIVNVVKEMYSHEGMQKFIFEHYDLLLKKIQGKYEVYDLLEKGLPIDCKRYVNDHLDVLLSEVSPSFIFSILMFEDLEELPSYANQFFESQNFPLLDEFLQKNKKNYLEFLFFRFNEMQVDSLYDILIRLIDEVLEHEGLKYIDIRLLKGGAYSEVLQIGDKILKLGKSRSCYQIPYDETILQPIIRFDLSKISTLPLVLEVMENVSTDVHLSKDELYSFYFKLRERGIVFADIKNENLGILLKDNLIHWNKSISSDNKDKGIDGENLSILKKGSIVILDTDYLYTEQDYYQLLDEGKSIWGNDDSRYFEAKYQLEKAKTSQKR